MGDDFRSLLSTFAEATGTDHDTTKSSFSSTKEKHLKLKSETNNSSSNGSSSSLLSSSSCNRSWSEETHQLWRIAEIRRATQQQSSNINTQTKMKSAIPPNTSTTKVHIAICVCIVDSLPQEHIWRSWLQHNNQQPSSSDTNTNQNKIEATAEIYIHAKHPNHPNASSWVRSKTIDTSYQPNWNDVRVVRAMLKLAHCALTDHNDGDTMSQRRKVTHVLFCTESCIPIVPLHQVATELVYPQSITRKTSSSNDYCHPPNVNVSFVNAYNGHSSQCTRFDELHCWNAFQTASTSTSSTTSSNSKTKQSSMIPFDAIYKSLPGWIVLCRNHMMDILDLNQQTKRQLHKTTTTTTTNDDDDEEEKVEFWKLFENVWAPEEVFFPTALALLGHIKPNNSSQQQQQQQQQEGERENESMVIPKSLMYAKWDTHASNHKDRAHPLIYTDQDFTKEFIIDHIIQNEGCLFMRKVKTPLDLSLWESIVLNTTTTIVTDGRPSGSSRNDSYETSSSTTRYSKGHDDYSSYHRSRNRGNGGGSGSNRRRESYERYDREHNSRSRNRHSERYEPYFNSYSSRRSRR